MNLRIFVPGLLLLTTNLLAVPFASAQLLGPSAPTELIAAPSAPGAITLSWNASSSLLGITSYRVFHVESDGNATPVGEVNGTTTSFTESGLAAGQTVTYVVTAVDATGESDASAPASATTWTVPDAPTDVQVAPGPGLLGEARVSWSAPAYDGGAAVLAYNVYRDGALVATLDAGATSFQDSGLTPFHAYAYQISALNAVGEGASGGACGMASPWTGALGCQGVL